MLNAKLICGDVKNFPVEKGFYNYVIYFTFSQFKRWGAANDQEVDTLMNEIGSVVRFSETIGQNINLAGGKRMSHIFEFIRVV